MTRLKHLSIFYDELSQDFFADIQTILPNIRYLDINSEEFSEGSLKSLLKSLEMTKNIERVIFNNDSEFYYRKNRLESKPRIINRAIIYSNEYIINE